MLKAIELWQYYCYNTKGVMNMPETYTSRPVLRSRSLTTSLAGHLYCKVHASRGRLSVYTEPSAEHHGAYVVVKRDSMLLGRTSAVAQRFTMNLAVTAISMRNRSRIFVL